MVFIIFTLYVNNVKTLKYRNNCEVKTLITSNKGKGERMQLEKSILGFKGNGNVLIFDYAQSTREVEELLFITYIHIITTLLCMLN